jgi:D-glycero-alpha-D-manno-heptose 1-phosphate guanylyltransferase
MILAGGMGTRLRTVVNDRPKPMAIVAGRPFIEILVESLACKGVRDFVFLTGHMADMIERHLAAWRPRDLTFRFSREPVPLGTGGAVGHAAGMSGDPTLLVNGDTYFDTDLKQLWTYHHEKQALLTLSLVHVEDASRYGSVALDGTGRIEGFREKDPGAPGPGLVNGGLSLISQSFIQRLPKNTSFSMERDVFPGLAAQGAMYGLVQSGAFFDIGTPASYRAFEHFVRKSGVFCKEPVSDLTGARET